MYRASLIYNPVAGRFPSKLLSDRVVSLLNQEGWQVSLESSQSGEHITELAFQAAAKDMDAVFVIGGDGSVNHAIAGLLNTRTALGVLPAGTANVWAREIGLTTLTWTRWAALLDSVRRLARGAIHPVDVGLCNGKPFLLWAGVGLDGYIVHRIEPRSRWEKSIPIVHYGASAIWYASQWHGLNIRVEVDGKQLEGHYLLTLASNIRLYAGGLIHLYSKDHLDDGLMDFWLLEGENMGDVIQLAWDLLTGRSDQSGQIHRLHFKQLRLESSSQLFIQLDGEPVLAQGSVEIQVLARSLRVIVPVEYSQAHFQQDKVSDHPSLRTGQ